MSQDVIELSKKLIEFPSVSRQSNAPISDYIQEWLEDAGATCERLEYTDPNGELKVNIIGKFGEGTGGLAFCSHSDTVPGQEEDWPAFEPEIKGERLYGRGAWFPVLCQSHTPQADPGNRRIAANAASRGDTCSRLRAGSRKTTITAMGTALR